MKTDSLPFFTEKCKFVGELFGTSDLTDSFPSHDQFLQTEGLKFSWTRFKLKTSPSGPFTRPWQLDVSLDGHPSYDLMTLDTMTSN